MNNPSKVPDFEMLAGGQLVRIDLLSGDITIGNRDWFDWHPDTQQVEIQPGKIRFVEPNGNAVGFKVISLSSGSVRCGEG